MNPIFIKQFGSLMKETRQKRRLSYEQLSEKLEFPKAKSTLKRYEDGLSKKIDILTMRDICDVLWLDFDKIITTFYETGDITSGDFDLHGELNNSQRARLELDAIDMLPQSFFLNFLKLSEDHKETVLKITEMFAIEDSQNKGD